MAALSPAAPTRPIEPTISCLPRAWMNLRLRNCEPLSVCRMQPATSPRRDTALLSAVTANRDFDVPLYWQCWKMDSPTVQTITGEVLSAAMSLRLRKK